MASIFDQKDLLNRNRKKPLAPTGSALSGLTPGIPPEGSPPALQTPQPPVQPGVFNQPPAPPVAPPAPQGVFAPPAPVPGAPQATPPTPQQPVQQTPVAPVAPGTGPTPIEVTPQDANILDSLNPELAQLVENALQAQVSGEALNPQLAAGNEAFARASQQARVAGGGAAAGQLGQGAANTAQQAIEQQILSAVGQKGLQEAIAMQEMVSQGIGKAVDLAKMNTAQGNFLTILDKDVQSLNQADKQFFANLMSQEEMLNLKLTSQKGLLAMQIKSNEKLAQDSNFLQQQGIDLENAKLYGYEDQNGEWVMGTLQMQSLAFQNSLNSQAGQGFANYITANPNADINDPALQNLGQALWESLGNDGPVDQAWLEARIAAVNDPSLTNPIIGTKAMLDDAVANGAITQEKADEFWENFMKTLSGAEGDDDDDDDDDDDGDLTTKQQFTKWAEDNMPPEFKDTITQQDWVNAGKPKTWEEFLANSQQGDPDDTTTPPIFGDDGTLAMTDKDINNIISQIEQGVNAVIGKYRAAQDLQTVLTGGIPEDLSENNMRGFVKGNVGKIVNIKGKNYVLRGRVDSINNGESYTVFVYDPERGLDNIPIIIGPQG